MAAPRRVARFQPLAGIVKTKASKLYAITNDWSEAWPVWLTCQRRLDIDVINLTVSAPLSTWDKDQIEVWNMARELMKLHPVERGERVRDDSDYLHSPPVGVRFVPEPDRLDTPSSAQGSGVVHSDGDGKVTGVAGQPQPGSVRPEPEPRQDV